jgi:hypothetical protein
VEQQEHKELKERIQVLKGLKEVVEQQELKERKELIQVLKELQG